MLRKIARRENTTVSACLHLHTKTEGTVCIDILKTLYHEHHNYDQFSSRGGLSFRGEVGGALSMLLSLSLSLKVLLSMLLLPLRSLLSLSLQS